jgi:hypothetical protein
MFDRRNYSASLPTNVKFDFRNESFIIESFVKVDISGVGSPVLISNKANILADSRSIGYNVSLTDTGSWRVNLADGNILVSADADSLVRDGKWHHIAMIVDRSKASPKLRLYQDFGFINKSWDLRSLGAVTALNMPVTFGRSTACCASHVHSQTFVTDIRIWKIRTNSITPAFFKGRRVFMPLCPDKSEAQPLLIAEFRFKEPEGDQFLDSAPFSPVKGTLQNQISRFRKLADRLAGITLCVEQGKNGPANMRIAFELHACGRD